MIERFVREHVAAATAALISRATGGRGYGRGGRNWQIRAAPCNHVARAKDKVGCRQSGVL